MASDAVEATLVGTAASTVAAVATWVLTARRRDKAEGDGFISDAAQAITESALALVAQHQAEVHDCREQLAEVRAELVALRAEVVALRG